MLVKILLDGIPYTLISALYGENKLPGFYKPVRLISTFPSLTEPAYSWLFLDGKVPSYGSIQYDETSKCLRVRSRKESLKFVFDFKQPDSRFLFEALKNASKDGRGTWSIRFFSFLVYLSRFCSRKWKTYIDYELEKARQTIVNSKKESLIVIFDSFDEFCHREGIEKTKERLEDFFIWLNDLRNEKPFEVLLFSDHGNTPSNYKYVNYKKILRKQGYEVTTNLHQYADILIPLYVSISFFPIYCNIHETDEVARFLSKQKGVDLVLHRIAENVIHVIKNGFYSQIRKIDNKFYYKIVTGDSLGLKDIIEKNSLECSNDGFFSNDWFSITNQHVYPNPLERIYRSFFDIKVKPNILVSLDDDTVYGYAFSHKLYNAVCMHGNIRSGSANAFILKSKDSSPIHEDVLNIYNLEI